MKTKNKKNLIKSEIKNYGKKYILIDLEIELSYI